MMLGRYVWAIGLLTQFLNESKVKGIPLLGSHASPGKASISLSRIAVRG